MSYSRWSNSRWYTYGSVNTVNEEPTLAILDSKSKPDTDHFSLSELKEQKEFILSMFPDQTPDEENQLREIIEWFVEDHTPTEAERKDRDEN